MPFDPTGGVRLDQRSDLFERRETAMTVPDLRLRKVGEKGESISPGRDMFMLIVSDLERTDAELQTLLGGMMLEEKVQEHA